MLKEKQIKFAEAYLRLGNIMNAAIEAGYSPKNANVQGNALLKNPSVNAFIEEARAKRQEESFLETMNVAKAFKQIFDRCMQHEPVMEFDYATKRMVPVRDEHGNAVYTFDANGANRAMENIAKHIGFFEVDNKQKAPVINIAIINNGNGDEHTQITAATANQLTDSGVLTLLPPSPDE